MIDAKYVYAKDVYVLFETLNGVFTRCREGVLSYVSACHFTMPGMKGRNIPARAIGPGNKLIFMHILKQAPGPHSVSDATEIIPPSMNGKNRKPQRPDR